MGLLGYPGPKAHMYADWEAVPVFYMAKHRVCIRMLLRGDEAPTPRRDALKYARPHVRKIRKLCQKLYDLGATARYGAGEEIAIGGGDEAMGPYREIEAVLAAEPGRGRARGGGPAPRGNNGRGRASAQGFCPADTGKAAAMGAPLKAERTYAIDANAGAAAAAEGMGRGIGGSEVVEGMLGRDPAIAEVLERRRKAGAPRDYNPVRGGGGS